MLATASAVTSTTPRWPRGLRGAEKGGFAARRLTPSYALVREEVQPDSGHSTRCVPMSTRTTNLGVRSSNLFGRARQNERAGRHEKTIGERLVADQAVLRALPEEPFEPCDKRPAKVSSTVRLFRTGGLWFSWTSW